jgi:hypothetical protein
MSADESMDSGTKSYRYLLAVVAKHLSLDEAKVLTDQRLEYEGVCLQFEYLAHTRLCRIGMELGPMAEDVESLKAMLESNAFPEEGLLPVMAFDPESGRPMVFVHFPAQEDAELSVRCFLDFGMAVFLGQWQEMWQDSELAKPATTVGMLA